MDAKCPIRIHFDNKEDRSFFVCSVCECNLGMHAYFTHCPLLDNEMICVDCCQQEVEKEEILKTFKDLGKEYTRAEIEKTCGDCGNRSCGARLPGDTL